MSQPLRLGVVSGGLRLWVARGVVWKGRISGRTAFYRGCEGDCEGSGAPASRWRKTYPNGSISPFDRLSSPALSSIVFGAANRNALGTLGLAPGAERGGLETRPSLSGRRGGCKRRVGPVGWSRGNENKNEQNKNNKNNNKNKKKHEREGRGASRFSLEEKRRRTDVGARTRFWRLKSGGLGSEGRLGRRDLRANDENERQQEQRRASGRKEEPKR